jgi:hypothetical protein
MNLIKPLHILFICLVFFSACVDEDIRVSGMRPNYISYDDLLVFEQLPPQPIVNAGKVLLYKQYLFLGEVNEGIHVIDVSDTLNPQKLSFLKIPGNKDLTAQNDRLYADNGPHLLILDISDIHQIKIVNREKNVFKASEFFPPDYTGDFECADYEIGWVVSWQTATLDNPQCKK